MANWRENFQSFEDSSDEEDNREAGQEISQFFTDKAFNSHQDLIEWVQATGRSLGYIIVTKRTRNRTNGMLSKIIFKCDRGGVYQSTKVSSKNTGTKKIDCPFSLKGKHSLVYDCWTINVICGTHNHAPILNMEGHAYAMRLSEEETRLVEDLSRNNVQPKNILSTLRNKNPANVSTSQTIYNALYKFRNSNNAGRSKMQVLMEFLRQEDYIHYTRVNANTNELEDLFFTHPKSLELWQAFPYVLLMDATYSTNRYKMPLLEIVGVTSTNMTFCIAFVYMHQEREPNYMWALNCLKGTWDGMVCPRVIVTDRELALMKACKVVFPDTKQLLCRWHISESIFKKGNKSIKSKALLKSVLKAWASLVESQTEEIYLYRMAEIDSLLVEYPDVLIYLNATWLNPYKEMFVSAWTDKFRNFGNHTTNRVESQHALLKQHLPSSQSDLDKSLTYIHSLIHTQESSIKASFKNSRTTVKHRFKKTHFENLCGFVSFYALEIIHQEFERSKFVGIFSTNCGCQVRSCYGLPCAHEQAEYSNEGQCIPLSSIDEFWRKLEISPCIPIQDEDIDCADEVQRFTQTFQKQSKAGKRTLLRKFKEIFVPPKTPIYEPVVHKSNRGRPSLKEKRFEKTIIDPPPQQPLRRSCSDAHKFIDPRAFSREPARHSTHFVNTSYSPHEFIDQFPKLFHPYISEIQNVRGDGNCGFRAISTSLNNDENDWPTVRLNLMQELNDHKDEYEMMFGMEYLGNMYNALNFFQTDINAPTYHWLASEMGILVASKYDVILHILGMTASTTYLPLRSYPPPLHERNHIAIGHVNGCHWVKITLNGDYPVPIITPQWHFYKYNCATGWATPYERRIDMYMQYFRSNRTPDHVIVE